MRINDDLIVELIQCHDMRADLLVQEVADAVLDADYANEWSDARMSIVSKAEEWCTATMTRALLIQHRALLTQLDKGGL